MTATLEKAKEHVRAVLERRRTELLEVSHAIHGHPETAFEEHFAAQRLSAALVDHGMEVEMGVSDLATAFSARAGHGPLVVALCAEYDALPGVGHACGHNIIAACALGATLALQEVADDVAMSVLLLGTPAEEGGGGKILMLDDGQFSDAHLAMMVHPWPRDRLGATCLAVSHFDVHFEGKEAHAAAAPFEGANASDAMTIAQVAIALLRQQFHPGDQAHGIVTDGGQAANVIPGHTSGRFMCRARTMRGLELLEPRVKRCFEAGALATGTTVRFESLAPAYSHMESDPELLACYRLNAEELGRRFSADDAGEDRPVISTDMANVSLALPSIHPMIGIESGGAINHQPQFASACISASADAAVIDGAMALAWTAIDAALTPTLRQRLLARSS